VCGITGILCVQYKIPAEYTTAAAAEMDDFLKILNISYINVYHPRELENRSTKISVIGNFHLLHRHAQSTRDCQFSAAIAHIIIPYHM